MKENLRTLFLQRIEKLNSRQKEAVETIEGPVLVVAGPGTGKTELLSLRVANILLKTDVAPSNILCLTFTDNGAKNMRDRLLRIIGQDVYKLNIHTFHSFAQSIINKYPEYFYEGVSSTLATDIEKHNILEKIFKALSHRNSMSKYVIERGGFIYLKDVKDRISEIKNSGFLPNEYRKITENIIFDLEKINNIFNTFWPERLSLKSLDWTETLIRELSDLKTISGDFYVSELKEALKKIKISENTEPLGQFKKSYLVKEEGVYFLKDFDKKEKLLTLCDLYEEYQIEMQKEGLHDYDDLIIDVREALKSNDKLKVELEEEYLYVLVDEFQDTSESQMRLIKELTNSPFYEGRPNLCVVGDDDQGIYKFQGAKINNIINFRSSDFVDVKTIVLETNYRSTQKIIDFARETVKQAGTRLETSYTDILKKLNQGNESLLQGSIEIIKYQNEEEEYFSVTKEVKSILEKDSEASIAVISREHYPLTKFSSFLIKENLAFKYSRKLDIFNLKPILDIFNFFFYINSISSPVEDVDHILPKILNIPFLKIKREDIFKISEDVKKNNKTWLEAISLNKNTAFIYDLFLDIHKEVEENGLEKALSIFIEKSGLKEFYFGKENLKENPQDYINFLGALHTLFEALSEYKKEEMLNISDFINLYEDCKKSGTKLTVKEVYGSSDSNIELLTAHGSKGLEYDYVFLIATEDSVWNKSGRGSLAPVPSPISNLISKERDSSDDFIRLLFVAITRAKHTLNISYTTNINKYIQSNESIDVKIKKIKDEDKVSALEFLKEPYDRTEKNILSNLVKDYYMPVTHLNNFLNVTVGGPYYFLQQNLLRFPQPMNSSSVFGTAVHDSIESIVKYKKIHNKDISEKNLIDNFVMYLKKYRLGKADYLKQEERGIFILKKYLAEYGENLKGEDLIEFDFRGEGILVGEALITGKIDYIKIDGDNILVLDFKTGKTLSSWDPKDEYDKIKAHHYKYQLIMYKILIENSSRFAGKKIKSLGLQFVEDEDIFVLYYEPTEDEINRLKKLIEKVYHKIINVDFNLDDDFSKASKLSDIIEYEESILSI